MMNTKTFNKHLLFETMSVQSVSGECVAMQNFILDFAESRDLIWTADKSGNIYITKGDAEVYPCVVAHMDTVHDILPKNEFSIIKHDGTWFAFNPAKRELTGIGGDDKVGIFVALSCLDAFEHVKVAFFVDEEVGCVGSRDADMTFFEDVSLVMQCDRRGYGEFVQGIYGTELFGTEFAKAVDPILEQYHVYRTHQGGITDVGELKMNGLAVAAANISCGYYLPHTPREYIVLKDVENTLFMVYDILEQLGDRKWTHIDEPKSTYSYGGYYYSSYGKWDSDYDGSYGSFGESKTSSDDQYDPLTIHDNAGYTFAYNDTKDMWECLGEAVGSGSLWGDAYTESAARSRSILDEGGYDSLLQDDMPQLSVFDACPKCGEFGLEFLERCDDFLCASCGVFAMEFIHEHNLSVDSMKRQVELDDIPKLSENSLKRTKGRLKNASNKKRRRVKSTKKSSTTKRLVAVK